MRKFWHSQGKSEAQTGVYQAVNEDLRRAFNDGYDEIYHFNNYEG